MLERLQEQDKPLKNVFRYETHLSLFKKKWTECLEMRQAQILPSPLQYPTLSCILVLKTATLTTVHVAALVPLHHPLHHLLYTP